MRKALLLLLLCIPLTVGGASKGLKIVVQDQSGKSIALYGDSHALLIGVSEYQATDWTDLESIPSELATVEKVLIEQGFNVEKHLNPNGKELKAIFQSFIDKHGYDPENRLLFFFSGHGWTKENGKKGYLVPADAPNPEKDQKNFLRKALPMSQVLAWARQTEAKHSLYLFDSCFSGTIFQTKSLPDKPPHITEATSLPVRQFITAGKANELVPSQSTFTPTFVDALKYGFGDLNKDGYVSGTELGLYLQEKVPRYGQQTPQFGKIQQYDLSRGDFIFVLPKASQVAVSSASTTSSTATSVDSSAIEIAFWNSIKDSKDQEMFEAYLKKYPAGEFSLLAKIELKKISNSEMVWCATNDSVIRMNESSCRSRNGKTFSSEYQAKAEHRRLRDLEYIWCATASSVTRIMRSSCSGQEFSSEFQAKAEQRRLKDRELVWCTTEEGVFNTSNSNCRDEDGKVFTSEYLANIEHQRLIDNLQSSKVALGDTSAPIIIPTHNWSSQIVMAHVIGELFEKLGYSVEYVAENVFGVYESIRQGNVTISHEVWESTMGRYFYAARAKGGLIDAGAHAVKTLEDVGVPQWVIDRNLCPGLPNWKALKNCKDVFAAWDSGGKGRILDGPLSWHGQEYVDRVDALLGNGWVVKFAGSAAAIWADHAAAKKEGRATLTFNWSPNFTDAEGFVFIEWPPYYSGCRKQDGGDSRCGSPRLSLKKAAWDGMPQKWPAAYKAFTRISFNKKMIGTMASYVDIDGMQHSDAARRWIRENKKVWSTWLYGPRLSG